MYNLQRTYGVWYNVLGFVRTSNFVPKPLGRFVNCELLIVFTMYNVQFTKDLRSLVQCFRIRTDF